MNAVWLAKQGSCSSRRYFFSFVIPSRIFLALKMKLSKFFHAIKQISTDRTGLKLLITRIFPRWTILVLGVVTELRPTSHLLGGSISAALTCLGPVS